MSRGDRDGGGDATVPVDLDDREPGADAPTQDHPYLIVLVGSRCGQMFKVDGTVTVGRGRDAGIQVTDDGVSRHHVRLTDTGDGSVKLEDLGSRNGTFVNAKRVTAALLRDGDKIHLGQTTILKFSYADRLEEQYQTTLYQAAIRDIPTGLFNRRHLDERLEAEFKFSVRHRRLLTAVMFDLDHFKRVNDAHGHLVGDEVLATAARILAAGVRGEDIAARYGGEEFMVLCRDTPPPMAAAMADRIRQQLAAAQLVPRLPDLRVTISAGVAGTQHPKINQATDLLSAADTALYDAKKTGRNRVVIFR
ncbi:MAG: GGDEF domain-containing protein [Deltaproteobacteria bacterium]|nr:GGDEF domain-containing protein [Deltaproteobacteria bacterium]